jgi:hypothetical protein
MLFGASSGTLYSIRIGEFALPFKASLFSVPGTAEVFPFDNLNANGCDTDTPLISK